MEDPNVSVTLPLEILDKILEQIPISNEGRRVLMACALVTTWWTGPSQRRLFSLVEVHEHNYERWMNGPVLSRSKTRLLGYVRSLRYSRVPHIGMEYQIGDLKRDPGECFSALRNLRALTLAEVTVEHVGEEGFRTRFSAFRETLTRLSLYSFDMSFSAFVALVDYFPNITTLRLDLFEPEPDEGTVPSLSRPLRGKLHIHEVPHYRLEFLERFAELDLEYEELTISSSFFAAETEFVKSALRISPSTVKFLRLDVEFESDTVLTIRDFQQLQELELEASWPDFPHQTILSSISSIELRKVILSIWDAYDRNDSTLRTESWNSIDRELCELVGRLGAMGCRHTLEVELRRPKGIATSGGEYDFTKFLPEFKEQGTVAIIDAA